MSGDPALAARGVWKAYGSTVALAGLDLSVGRGEIVALLGPNGAGKTTLVSVVAGLRRPDRGTVQVLGRDVAADPAGVRRQLGVAPQETGVYPTLSVRQNLSFPAGVAGQRRRERRAHVDTVADALGLGPLLDRRAGDLSGGERRRVHTAMALVHDPPLVLLDEPTTGADVETRAAILAFVRDLARRGTTVVYSTHYLHEVEDLAATVAILHRGRITARGTLDALVAQHHASALRLTFDGPVPAAVRATPGVTADGPVAQLPCPDPAATAAQLLARLDPDDTPLRTLEIDRPSLETVFLAATHAPPTPDPAAEPVPA